MTAIKPHRLVAASALLLTLAACSHTSPTAPKASESLFQLWAVPAAWPFLSTPAVSDSSAYLMTTLGSIAEIRLRDGAITRQFTSPEFAPSAGIVRDGTTLFATQWNSFAVAIDIPSLSARWSNYVFPADSFSYGEHPEWVISAPLVDDSRVYFTSQSGRAYCLDRATGRLVWQLVMNAGSVARPTLLRRELYIAGSDSTLCVVEPATGRSLRRLAIGEEVEFTAPDTVGDRILVGGSRGALLCLEPTLGAVLWKADLGAGIRTDVSISSAAICVGTPGGIFALDPLQGRLLWQRPYPGALPVQADGLVYYQSTAGTFYVFAARTGQAIATLDLSRATLFGGPVVLPDRILVPTYGMLYCISRPNAAPTALAER